MTIRADANGTPLEFPDGTSPDVIQATVKKVLSQKQGHSATTTSGPFGLNLKSNPDQSRKQAVVQNAAMSAVASIPDMFLNAPVNAWNIAKSIPSMVQGNLLPEQTKTPDVVRRTMEHFGAIKPQDAPQTPGEEYLSAGVQGAVAGAPGGIPGMLMGSAGNLLGHAVQKNTGSPVAGLIANLSTTPLVKGAQTYTNKQLALADQLRKQKAPLTEAMQRVRSAGYVIPPGTTNPTMGNRIMESLGGKQALGQDASIRNEEVVGSGIRKQLKLPPEAALTEDALEAVAAQRARPYTDIAALPAARPKTKGFDYHTEWGPPSEIFGKAPKEPAKLLEQLRSARLDAKQHWRHFEKQGDPAAYKAYQSNVQKSKLLEMEIENAARAAGKPQLIEELRKSRQEQAQIHDVIRALNPADTGEVSAMKLARAQANGVPLTGELETAAIMGNRFPKAVQKPESVGTPGAHNLAPMMGGGMGGGFGALAGGAPGATLGSVAGAIATPYAQMLIRDLLLSKSYQLKHGMPDYGAGRVSKSISSIPASAEDALIRAYIQALQQGQQ